MGIKSTTKKLFVTDETKSGVPHIDLTRRLDVIMRFPHRFDDVHECADALLAGNVVMFFLDAIDGAERNRIFDYMNGVAYIVEANVSAIGDSFLLYTPPGVSIDRPENM